MHGHTKCHDEAKGISDRSGEVQLTVVARLEVVESWTKTVFGYLSWIIKDDCLSAWIPRFLCSPLMHLSTRSLNTYVSVEDQLHARHWTEHVPRVSYATLEVHTGPILGKTAYMTELRICVDLLSSKRCQYPRSDIHVHSHSAGGNSLYGHTYLQRKLGNISSFYPQLKFRDSFTSWKKRKTNISVFAIVRYVLL